MTDKKIELKIPDGPYPYCTMCNDLMLPIYGFRYKIDTELSFYWQCNRCGKIVG